MMFYIKVEDINGVIKSYLRFNDESTAYKVYQLIVEECLHKGDTIKLMDENFQVLAAAQTTQPTMAENSNDTL